MYAARSRVSILQDKKTITLELEMESTFNFKLIMVTVQIFYQSRCTKGQVETIV